MNRNDKWIVTASGFRFRRFDHFQSLGSDPLTVKPACESGIAERRIGFRSDQGLVTTAFRERRRRFIGPKHSPSAIQVRRGRSWAEFPQIPVAQYLSVISRIRKLVCLPEVR